jgi:hypothetical protein
MIELEADDALASAAHIATKDKKVEKVAIWTPDKDLAQCVRDARVVQIDGRRKIIRDAAAIREKFGLDPPLIPDLLALVGDAADGYPGIPGIGTKTAAQLSGRLVSLFPNGLPSGHLERDRHVHFTTAPRLGVTMIKPARCRQIQNLAPGAFHYGDRPDVAVGIDVHAE